jgi:prevent-host-death family protein
MILVMTSAEVLPLATVKARFSEVVERVVRHHERVVVTRNGSPVVVVLSTDDLEALEATLELLSDTDAMRRLAEADADLAAGRVVTGEELAARYLNKG